MANDLESLASEVLAMLRKGEDIGSSRIEAVTTSVGTRFLRSLVGEQDETLLLSMCRSKDVATQRLAISLLRALKGDEDVETTLFSMWDDPLLDPFVRAMLLWFILDYEHISDATREQIYGFVRGNLDTFRKHLEAYVGEDALLDLAEDRIRNQTFHDRKSFIYLCSAFFSPRRDDYIGFVTSFLEADDPLTRRVAEEMLNLARGQGDRDVG